MGTLIHKILIRIIGIVVLPLGFFILFVFDNLRFDLWDALLLILVIGTCVSFCFLKSIGRIGWILLIVSAIGKHTSYFIRNWDARGLETIDYYRNHFPEISAYRIFWDFIDVWILLIICVYLFLPPVSRIFREKK